MSDPLSTADDTAIPFLFENLPVRGALIQLKTAWARMQLGHDYAEPVAQILGQAAAATGLIAQSLKFDGTITLQVSGDGPLSMLVMQSNEELHMRGMANAPDVTAGASYADLVRESRCAITVDSGANEQPYQGIVEMTGDSLSDSLANYFTRSAQIESHIVLVANRSLSAGLLLQQMPGEPMPGTDDWLRLGLLADTLRTEDFVEGVSAELLGRLFAEDDIRVFDAQPAAFRCRCSRQRAEEVLQLLGEDETREACEELGRVDVICEYCGRQESFDPVDIANLFAPQVHQGSDSIH